MRVKMRSDAGSNTFASDYCVPSDIYKAEKEGGIYTITYGPTEYDWFALNEAEFAAQLEILEDKPPPAILTGRVETQEDIEERLGADGRDPLAKAVKEIMQYQEDLHKLVAARAQQIEICKLLLLKIDHLSTGLPFNSQMENRFRIGEIKKFIQAGAEG